MSYIIKFLIWIFWDFSGLRYIIGKIYPPIDPETNKRKPATFFLWLIASYLTLYGIASQRYENRVDIIENRANIVFTQIVSNKKSLERLPDIQQMTCPVKPVISSPISIFISLFSKSNTYNSEIVDQTKTTVETWKDFLSTKNFWGINLKGVVLRKSNLQDVILGMANLEDADLSDTNLTNADLKNANLRNANLSNVNFLNAELRNANLTNANLNSAKNLTENQISQVKTLYNAQIDLPLKNRLEQKYRLLFINNTKVSEQ